MRVLMLTTVLPHGRSGGELVTAAFADAIRSGGHELRMIGWLRPGQAPSDDHAQLAVGERAIETATASAVARAGWTLRAAGSNAPYSVAKYAGRSYSRLAARESARAELVIADHAQVGPVARAVASAPLVLIAHNAERDLYAQQATGQGIGALARRREARLIGREEKRLAASAAAVWALTADDAASFRALGARSVAQFDIPVAKPAPGTSARDARVVVLGNWTWDANARGLRWFVDEVVPRLPPAVDVRVGGAGADWLAGHGRVDYSGRVASAADFLSGARVVAVPSVAGGGVQVKTLDAIASGGWVVATPTALRGIGEPPPTVVRAGDAESFARAVAELCLGDQPPPAEAAWSWTEERALRFSSAVASELARLAPSSAPARNSG